MKFFCIYKYTYCSSICIVWLNFIWDLTLFAIWGRRLWQKEKLIEYNPQADSWNNPQQALKLYILSIIFCRTVFLKAKKNHFLDAKMVIWHFGDNPRLSYILFEYYFENKGLGYTWGSGSPHKNTSFWLYPSVKR